MARANPARSAYAATRHLLRNLHNSRELRRNPLVRAEFAGRTAGEALRAIATRVDSALREVGSARQVAILLRVDTERHDARSVAADLALSMRQFYRERRHAHAAFHAGYLAAARAPASVESDFPARLLSRATSLADSGETASARAILADVLASGLDAATACDALLRLATTEAWLHRFDEARAHLDECSALLARETFAPERRAALSDGANATRLTLVMFAEGPGAALRSEHQALPDASATGDRTTLARALAALRVGEAPLAGELLHALARSTRDALAPELEVDLLTARAEFANFAFSNASLGEELFGRAALLAGAHGLRGRELYARHQLSVARWMRSRRPDDRREYRQLADAVDRSLPARLRSILALVAADVEVAIGRPERGLAAANTVASVSTNRYESVSARALAAAALLRMGRLEDAATESALAREAARAEGHARVLSLAQRICAQAYFIAGNRRAARTAIEESIECARRFSSPYVQAQAQAIRGRIAGRS
ncbi:MAG TPA: hypothetical protein VEW74_00265 [Candidatus Nitrosotalea sp.]|nr:hypothetical protein [Candidatus Nitrosotalea sp.]